MSPESVTESIPGIIAAGGLLIEWKCSEVEDLGVNEERSCGGSGEVAAFDAIHINKDMEVGL